MPFASRLGSSNRLEVSYFARWLYRLCYTPTQIETECQGIMPCIAHFMGPQCAHPKEIAIAKTIHHIYIYICVCYRYYHSRILNLWVRITLMSIMTITIVACMFLISVDILRTYIYIYTYISIYLYVCILKASAGATPPFTGASFPQNW